MSIVFLHTDDTDKTDLRRGKI